MSFETVSLLLSWLEFGVLFAILSRLSRTFDLIANTQRELRQAIHHLSEHRPTELDIHDASVGSKIPLVARSVHFRPGAEMS